MTPLGRFLVARKQAMSAMMPSDTRNKALLIKAFKHTDFSAIKEAFSYIQLMFTGEGCQNYFSRGSRVYTTDSYI